jgi:aspartate/methionine/tyrosine aminotransferase
MSKILYPSLRLGYLVVPEKLIDSMAKIRSVMDQHSPAIDQATLARFIAEDFSSAMSNGCENSMPIGESSSSRNSINCSVIASFSRFRKQD